MIYFKFVLYLLSLAFFFPSQNERLFVVHRLTTNHIEKPLGLEETPFFGWQIRSEIRKTFESPENIITSRLYISGLGYHETFINGQKVGDHILDPAIKRYDQRVKYVVHDVTELLRKGKNVIGVVLGNGWYNQHTLEAWDFDQAPWRAAPALRAQLKVLDTSGMEHWIHTDKNWKFSLEGPVIFDGVHNGEIYDTRKESYRLDKY